MELIIDIISGIFIAIGCVFTVGGAIGLIRMPEFYTRLHAASVTDTGGILFIMIGLVLQAMFVFDNPMAAIKLTLVVIFIFFTAPTASHAVAKAALMADIIPQCQDGRSVVHKTLASIYHDRNLSSVLSDKKDSNTSEQRLQTGDSKPGAGDDLGGQSS